MSRGRAKSVSAPAAVTVTYDLFDLPTAQHKAGLAGLLLQLASMQERKKLSPIYQWDEVHPTNCVSITFTAETVQELFTDLYAAEVVEKGFPQKKPKEHLKREDVREIGGRKTKLYVYDVVRPILPALTHYLGGGSSSACWLSVWRDMLWAVPRGVNTTRIPFEVVAGWDRKRSKEQRRVPPKPCPEGSTVWQELVKFDANRNGPNPTLAQLDGKLWLGAQKTNAEQLEFRGRVEYNLLLHFWPLATLIYLPQTFKVLREKGRIEARRRYDGFALAIPDVADLQEFCDRFRATLHEMGSEQQPHEGRPRSGVVEIAAQGALALIDRDRVSGLAMQKAGQAEFRYSIHGVDYLHFRPGKNGPRMLSAGHVELRPHLAEDYEAIAGPPGRKPPFANPLFRRGLMIGLIDGVPWFRPFGKMLAEWDSRFFIHSESSPKKLSWFWADARKKFQQVIQTMPTAPHPSDPTPESDDVLAAAINRIVRRYLDERLKKDTGHDFDRYREEKKTPPDAAEARRKLAERLFLEFRSRRDQAFIDHFSGTFFAVSQYLGHKPVPRLFEKVAGALMHRTDDVKTLTLMALSANSWSPAKKKETAQ